MSDEERPKSVAGNTGRTGNLSAMPREPRGIGGWLLLPALGLTLAPFTIGYRLCRDLLLLKPEIWSSLTQSSSAAYDPAWRSLIIFEVAAHVALFAGTLWLLWLFFHKSERVPNLMVTWIMLIMGVRVADLLLSMQIPAVASQSGGESLVPSILGAVIWIAYWTKAKRVKNTFTGLAP
jgi:uncharacterized membrane protein YeaQ/YmgE (transglycosylase-associated protein family)